MNKRLGVGFVGSGFNAKFHMQGFRAVRDADVLGVWSPRGRNAEKAAEYARGLDLGIHARGRGLRGRVGALPGEGSRGNQQERKKLFHHETR